MNRQKMMSRLQIEIETDQIILVVLSAFSRKTVETTVGGFGIITKSIQLGVAKYPWNRLHDGFEATIKNDGLDSLKRSILIIKISDSCIITGLMINRCIQNIPAHLKEESYHGRDNELSKEIEDLAIAIINTFDKRDKSVKTLENIFADVQSANFGEPFDSIHKNFVRLVENGEQNYFQNVMDLQKIAPCKLSIKIAIERCL